MSTWGRRIPFLLGLPLTIVCFLARRSVPVEEPAAGAHEHAGVPIVQVIRKYPRALLNGIGLGIAVQGGAYISLTYITIYLVNNLHYGKQSVYWLTTAVTVFAVALMPFTGRLTDRIGALPVAVIGIPGYAVLVFPALVLMGRGSFGLVVVGYLVLMVPIAFLQVASYTLSPLLFDAPVREHRYPARLRRRSVASGPG
ncbi:MFS transporter [Amycolatopsis sp. NPDC004368]